MTAGRIGGILLKDALKRALAAFLSLLTASAPACGYAAQQSAEPASVAVQALSPPAAPPPLSPLPLPAPEPSPQEPPASISPAASTAEAPAAEAEAGAAAPGKSALPRLRFAVRSIVQAPRKAAAALRSLFGDGGPAENEPQDDALVPALETLTTQSRRAEALYYSSVRSSHEQPRPPETMQEVVADALALARRRAAAAQEPKGWRAWTAEKLSWLQGELKEKIDLRATVVAIKKLAVTEGRNFALFAIGVEAFEDLVAPAILTLMGHKALIPFALAFHTEPVVYPLYFAARYYFSHRILWKTAGNHARYKTLKDFRARLMNEDATRRVEKLAMDGFPSQSSHGRITVNVNRSKLPVWVPLRVRNWYDSDFRWYDLYISINELAVLAPRPIVKELRGYYKDYPRAVSRLLTQAILENGPVSRARLVQNLAFKYWLNVGFDDMQPSLLAFLDPEERDLVERNRAFASGFFIQATPQENRRIKTFVADVYAVSAVERAVAVDRGAVLDVVAPFLRESYPHRHFSKRYWLSSPQAVARLDFIARFLISRGRIEDGPLTLAGETIAAVKNGKIAYADASVVEKILTGYRSSLNGAEQFLKRYERARPNLLTADAFDSTRVLTLASGAVPSSEPQLLMKIYWLKQSLLPETIAGLIERRRQVHGAMSGAPRRRAKRALAEQLAKAKNLAQELERAEIAWLRDYHESRFVSSESEVPEYAAAAEKVSDVERRALELGSTPR